MKALRPLKILILAGTILIGNNQIVNAESFTQALTSGKPKLDVRLRYEQVDQDNSLDEAEGLTIRTRLGYETESYMNTSAFVEFENTSAIVEEYNSGPGGNGETSNSVIADPDGNEVNQAYLSFSGISDTVAKIGRQRIIQDKARFIGNVGWRQNEQTYDAIRLINKGLADTVFDYSYVRKVNNIFLADVDTKSHLLNLSYTGLGFGKVTAYGYFQEFPDAETTSRQTVGARISGASKLGGAKFLYTLEYAKQSEYEDGNDDIDADYIFLETGATISGITGKIGYEVLGADDVASFETPFATKHAYNGWADIFLNTPDGQGLKDAYFLVSGKVSGIKLLAAYHDFSADEGGSDYGTEVDLLAVRKFGKQYSAGIKYANYNADDFAVDTEKVWIWAAAKF